MESVQIITLFEKHGQRSFLADTPEELDRVARGVIVERMDPKYPWYFEPQPSVLHSDFAAVLLLTDEQVASLPESVRAETATKRDRAARAVAEAGRFYQIDLVFWHAVCAIRDNPDEPTLYNFTTRAGTVVQRSRAHDLLEDRSDYEYERIEVQLVRRWP